MVVLSTSFSQKNKIQAVQGWYWQRGGAWGVAQ